ncbi:hypothetical protein [Halpernia sp. GG3]
MSLKKRGTSNYWDILADANTGEILKKENLTLSCDFVPQSYKSIFTKVDKSIVFSDLQTIEKSSKAAIDASYRVFTFQ